MYVISSALMLRSIMPGQHVGNVINDALGSGAGVLDTRFVDLWFKAFFMAGVGLTAAGVWMGRKFGAEAAEWADWEAWDAADVEMGKRL